MELTKEEEKELKGFKSTYVYEVSIKHGSDDNALLFGTEEEAQKYIKFVRDRLIEEEGEVLKDENVKIDKRFLILDHSTMKYSFSNSCHNILTFVRLYKQRKESLVTKKKEEDKKKNKLTNKEKLLYSHYLRKGKKEE